MNYLKKINRGAVVSFIVILSVIIYLIGLDIVRNSEKPEIRKAAENYISTYLKYNMLPENYKEDVSKIPKKDFDDYILKMETDIKSLFAADDDTFKYVTDMLKNNLENQKTQNNVVYGYEKEIKDIKYKFDKSVVTVTISSNSKYDGPDKINLSAGRSKLNAITTDILILEKTNGNWKIIYSDIEDPSKANSLGGKYGPEHNIMIGRG